MKRHFEVDYLYSKILFIFSSTIQTYSFYGVRIWFALNHLHNRFLCIYLCLALSWCFSDWGFSIRLQNNFILNFTLRSFD